MPRTCLPLTSAPGTTSRHRGSAWGLAPRCLLPDNLVPRPTPAGSPCLPDSQAPLTSIINTIPFWTSQILTVFQGSHLSPGLLVFHLPGHIASTICSDLILPPKPQAILCNFILSAFWDYTLLFTLCHFSTSYSLSCHSVLLPSQHLQKLRNEDPRELHSYRCFCLGKWLINPNGFLLPNRFCMHNIQTPFSSPHHNPFHSQWPGPWLEVPLAGLLWGTWGSWSVGAETADTDTGHPQKWVRHRQPGSGLLRQNREARK